MKAELIGPVSPAQLSRNLSRALYGLSQCSCGSRWCEHVIARDAAEREIWIFWWSKRNVDNDHSTEDSGSL